MDDQQAINLVQNIAKFFIRTNAYLARAEIERILSNYANDSKRLETHGFKVYSQNDEDGIIEEIFRRLGIERGNFCEIGVGMGWSVILSI